VCVKIPHVRHKVRLVILGRYKNDAAQDERHGLKEFEDLVDLLERLSDLPSEDALFEMLPDRWTPRTP
jgi:hypothetical protein